MATIGINGFGRIGKIIFLQLIEKNANVVALNVPDFDINNIETYLRHDSVHNYNTDWSIEIVNESMFKIKNKVIHILNSRVAKDLNWKKYGVNYLIDASGVYLTHDKAKEHNVDYVIMCAPPKDNTPSFMVNGNHESYNGENIVSNSSCTSNSIIPVLKVINDNYIIENANFITIHSSTSSQQIVDTVKFKNRTSRSCINNIIPHTTGASKSVYQILPELKDKIFGTSVRVPVSNVSLIDLNLHLRKHVTLEDLLSKLNSYNFINIDESNFKISCDYNTTKCPSIIDSKACMDMKDNNFKLAIWYDNEWSYSCKVIELLEYMFECNNKKIKNNNYFIENKELKGKRVVLRLDWNVPLKYQVVNYEYDKFKNRILINDFFRIKSTLKTIDYIMKQDPKYLLIVSHLGRPKDKDHESCKFENIFDEIKNFIKDKLNYDILLLKDGVSLSTKIKLNYERDNKYIFLLENIRFLKEETENTEDFKEVQDMYMSLGDVFINDAFACCHRDHLSITTPLSFDWGYGYLINKEISCLSDIINNYDNSRILAIMGGAKMDDKLKLLDNLSKKIDGIYLAGGNINSILKEEKYSKYIESIKNNKSEIYVMIDGLVGKDLLDKSEYSLAEDLKEDKYFFDIGMQSIVELTNLIDKYDVIFWNGTLGVVENKLYQHGSVSLVNYLINSKKKVIIGGGDTACFVNKYNHNFYYVSTGGGASLDFLSHGKLVGLSLLD